MWACIRRGGILVAWHENELVEVGDVAFETNLCDGDKWTKKEIGIEWGDT